VDCEFPRSNLQGWSQWLVGFIGMLIGERRPLGREAWFESKTRRFAGAFAAA
jgi:hypothetical protein